MDNVTHTLAAVALSHTGLNRKTRFATLTLIVGANLPDIDLVAALGGGATYLNYHRGFTHSILGAALLATLLGGAAFFLGRKAPAAKKAGPPVDARWLLITAWIALASHVLMDFTNSYGIRPFLPFSGRWYAWDIMPIIDPLLLALLVLGLASPALFRLISEEVGARKTSYRGGAIFALVSMLVLWGVRDLAHRRVLGFLDSHTYAQEYPLRIGAFPAPINPFSLDRSGGNGFGLPPGRGQRSRGRRGRGTHQRLPQTRKYAGVGGGNEDAHGTNLPRLRAVSLAQRRGERQRLASHHHGPSIRVTQFATPRLRGRSRVGQKLCPCCPSHSA